MPYYVRDKYGNIISTITSAAEEAANTKAGLAIVGIFVVGLLILAVGYGIVQSVSQAPWLEFGILIACTIFTGWAIRKADYRQEEVSQWLIWTAGILGTGVFFAWGYVIIGVVVPAVIAILHHN